MSQEKAHDDLHNEGGEGHNPHRITQTEPVEDQLYRSDVLGMMDRVEAMLRQSLSAAHRAEYQAEISRLTQLLDTLTE